MRAGESVIRGYEQSPDCGAQGADSKREASPKARRFVVGENAGQRDTTGNLATGFSDVQSLTAFVNCA